MNGQSRLSWIVLHLTLEPLSKLFQPSAQQTRDCSLASTHLTPHIGQGISLEMMQLDSQALIFGEGGQSIGQQEQIIKRFKARPARAPSRGR